MRIHITRQILIAGMIGWTVLTTDTPAGAQDESGVDVLTAQPTLEVVWKTVLESPSFGSAAVADIDDDGRLEIAFGTYFGDNSVRVLNAEDGSEYWRFDAGNACVDASLRFTDLDGDGSLELIVPISNLGWVLAFDAKTGDEKWRYATDPIECTDTPPAIVDFDGDGDLEVIYGTFYGNLHVISKDGRRERLFQPTKNFVQTGPVARDLNGDGIRDLICATFKGDNCIYAVDGSDGKQLWKYRVPGEHIGMYHGPSIGDLDDDDQAELIFGAYDGIVRCLRASDGKQLWEFDIEDTYIMAPTVIADLNQDNRPEIVVASQHMTVLDAKGQMLWSKPCAGGGFDAATRGASVADLNGDGRLDVASLSGTGMFRVFDGMTGKQLYKFDADTLCDQPVVSSSHGVTIADMTGDGKLDVFFVVGGTRPEKHGMAVCLSGFKGSGAGWYMLRHDPENTGNLSTELDSLLRQRVENLKPAGQATSRPARAPRFGAASAARKTVKKTTKTNSSMESVYQMAKDRGIPATIVDDARNHVSDFKKHGADGFRAVCLLIETGNHGGIRCHPLLQATWEAGLENELLKLCSRDSLPNYGLWSALQGLGYADTDEVRTYLLERLNIERDAGLFMSIAAALGQLTEKRAIIPVARQILRFEPRWNGVEPHLLAALHQMDAELAVPWLQQYVVHEKASRFRAPLSYIARVDKQKALELATNILSDRQDLSTQQLNNLKRFTDE